MVFCVSICNAASYLGDTQLRSSETTQSLLKHGHSIRSSAHPEKPGGNSTRGAESQTALRIANIPSTELACDNGGIVGMTLLVFVRFTPLCLLTQTKHKADEVRIWKT